MRVRTSHPQYEILEQCGRGGMSVVYRARDKRLNRIVALKFPTLDAEDSPDPLVRFRREAQAIAALNHPHIAVLYEVGEWDGEPFLALEYFPGGSLKDRVVSGGLPLDEIMRYCGELGAGLEFAHSQGILHRDIKPRNAMFSAHGVLKLLDFGLAKTATALDITQSGASVGTVGYMAPELLRGRDATVRSDLYAFAALVYELAAGRPMFVPQALGQLVEQVLASAPVPLSSLRPDLPPAVLAAVAKAAAPRPEDRYESVTQFLDELGCGRPVALPPAFLATRTLTVVHATTERTRLNRRRTVWAAAVLAGLAGLIGIARSPVGEKIHLTRPAHVSTEQTLVVLPFENLGADPANQELCAGLQETVTDILSAAGELKRNLMVVPSSEVRRNQVHTISEAHRQFKADLVVTGTSQKGPSDLRLTLNLSDARQLRQTNSRIITVPLTETGSLQDRLVLELGALLGSGPLRPGSAPGAGQTTANSAAYDVFLQGRGALEKGNFEDAARLLRQALDADPQFALARAYLAQTYLRENSATRDPKWLALADAEISRAAERGSIPEVLLVQAMIRKATGDSAAAIDLFRRLLQVDPANVEAYRYLAEALEAAHRNSEAEQTLQQGIRLRPGYWPLYQNLGIFYFHTRQYAGAEQALSTGISLAPEVPTLYFNLGAVYFTTGRWPEAADAFRKSLAIKPNALAYSNLGTVYFFQRQYEESAKQFEEATKLQPANPVNWGNLGDARWQIPGRRDQARVAFDQAALLASRQLAINPEDVRLRKSYALYLAKLGRSGDAVAEIGKVIAQAPDDSNVHFSAARVYAVTGDLNRALAEVQKSLALGFNPKEIEGEPDLAAVRQDPRYRKKG